MDNSIRSKPYIPSVPDKQDVDKDSFKKVNIVNKRATLVVQNILGSDPPKAATTTSMHANQTTDPLASKSNQVASDVWKGEGKPPLPPRKKEREAARKAQLEAYARQMAPDANVQLNSVGVINVRQLEKAGYTFHEELGICLSADGKTVVELDVLNQTKQDIPN